MTTLASFAWTNGFSPHAGLTVGSDGHFYGTTVGGGELGYGTLFRLTPGGDLTTLHSFDGMNGCGPDAVLVVGGDGELYGTTRSSEPGGNGVAYRFSTNGGFSLLATFNNPEGAEPHAELVEGVGGELHGTTVYGGSANMGTIFRLSTNHSITTLASFQGNNGSHPAAGLTAVADGTFFGTTYDGGDSNLGTIYRISGEGQLTTLVSFVGTNGAFPQSTLVVGTNGLLYGSTSRGGQYDAGTVFCVTTNGLLTTLLNFDSGSPGNTNGFSPVGNLTLSSDGSLVIVNYYSGGANAYGVLLKMSHDGQILSSQTPFNSTVRRPVSSPLQPKGTNLYLFPTEGGTEGQIARFNPATPGLSAVTSVAFTGTNGSIPTEGLIQTSDGSLFGTTSYGGTNASWPTVNYFYSENHGTLLRLSLSGSVVSVGYFTGDNGIRPDAELIEASDGNLYGTASLGGSGGGGNIFAIIRTPPKLHSVTTENNTFTFDWDAIIGRNYQVQWRTNPIVGIWTNLGNPVTATNATMRTMTANATNILRLYRVVLLE